MRQRIESLEQFRALQAEYMAAREAEKRKILVCCGTGCVAGGNLNVYHELKKRMDELGIPCEVSLTEHHDDSVGLKKSGCHGFCEHGPLVIIYPEGTFYCRVKPEDVEEIVESHLFKGRIVERLLYHEPLTHEQIPSYSEINFYKKQKRLVLEHCGAINPEQIEEYIAVGGYEALAKAVTTMTPQEVIDEVKKSGLRGRGGGGFPTGMKWQFAANSVNDKKYVICNADEGDPGAFMDRSVLEGDPHKVLEGMAICGYAIGADEGYIYVRAEYPLAIKRLRIAIDQAEQMGLLGKSIFGSKFSFKIHIKEGAGAFVCGEETALMASIEGRRGMPRPRPPFPAVSGLWGKPTNINNVETFANVASIITNGADWYCGFGTEKSKGTKVFALTGGENSPQALCAKLCRFGLGGVQVYVGENLSYDNENISSMKAEEAAQKQFSSLSVMMIINKDAKTLAHNVHGLNDDLFMRSKVPMTKQEIRAVSISKLMPQETDVIYDIGAGTGSCSIELALQAKRGVVYAFERNPEAVQLIEKNKELFGVENLTVIAGEASEKLEEMPVPDCVFIGGSGGNLCKMLDTIYAKNVNCRVVINAITVETLIEVVEYYKQHEAYALDIVNVFAARAKKLGAYNLMMSQNPVYIMTALKKGE